MHIDLSKYDFFSQESEIEVMLLPKQGYSNKNYVFTYQSSKYLLRQFILQDRDRKLEFQVQFMAYEKRLAAKPIVLDLDEGLMICEFLAGEHKTALSKKELTLLVQELKILHTMKLDKNPLNITALFESPSVEVRQNLKRIEAFPKELVLCHNDLNPKNLLFSIQSLKFIDWEFADMNDLYFDLAAVSVEFSLELLDEAYMLTLYFGKSGWNKKKLDAYKIIYKALCKQWFKENT